MPREIKISGVAASGGIAIGNARILEVKDLKNHMEKLSEFESIEEEVERLKKALDASVSQIERIQETHHDDTSVYQIFDAYKMILLDGKILEECIKLIREEKINAVWALNEIIKRYKKLFGISKGEDSIARVQDIEDLHRMLLENIISKESVGKKVSYEKNTILVAKDLSPSETINIDTNRVKAFITDVGSLSSHSAIMAQSLGIPAVVGAKTATLFINNGDKVIVDGIEGQVIVNPQPHVEKKYNKRQKKYQLMMKDLKKQASLPTETKDNYKVELSANIELPGEIKKVRDSGASGIGLFRTEYIFLNRDDLPTEDEQFSVYKKVVKGVHPESVIIRTIDLGGDKFISKLDIPKEMNPFMGWRAIRFCLERVDIFKTQLRAILRASAFGNLKIMFPMISDIRELRRAKEILEDVKKELNDKGISFDEEIEVGIMVEVPSVAISAGIYAKEVDFFSIGTNDLIQYTLAVDRVNERIAHMYEPFHPSVLKLIHNVIEEGHNNGIWVGVCGEMAGDPLAVMLFIGMSIDELSVNFNRVPEVKYVVRSISYTEMREVVKKVLDFETAREIKSYLIANTPVKELKFLDEAILTI
jgi:phosphotransferase system enzyme I (PtsI)